MNNIMSGVGLGDNSDMSDNTLVSGSDGSQSPIVFCYSLFYVYYDQYTYITGVLAQDVMLGLIAVFVSIQVSQIHSPYFNLDPFFNPNISFHNTLCVFGVLLTYGLHVASQRSTWRLSS